MVRQVLASVGVGLVVGGAGVAAMAGLWHAGYQAAALLLACVVPAAWIVVSVVAARGPRRSRTAPLSGPAASPAHRS